MESVSERRNRRMMQTKVYSCNVLAFRSYLFAFLLRFCSAS